MKKKLLLLSIIIFPSLIYFMFELTQANFKKMPFFGPKGVDAKGDTQYYTIPNIAYFDKLSYIKDTLEDTTSVGRLKQWKADSIFIDTINYPVYAILFLDPSQKKEGYHLEGLYDYVKYKTKYIKDVPLFFVSELSGALNPFREGVELRGEFDSLKINLPNFHPILTHFSGAEKTKFLSETYFKQKPVYVFNYFMVLVDKKRHIRGYYDPSYNAEVKRMSDEYKHLKIRDEYAETLKQNDIKQK